MHKALGLTHVNQTWSFVSVIPGSEVQGEHWRNAPVVESACLLLCQRKRKVILLYLANLRAASVM